MKVLLFSCMFLLLSSCNFDAGEFGDSNYNFYRIDTLDIHGIQHEFIISDRSSMYNGFIHSPECWCLTKKDKQND